ncbi:MAG: hypothetical protein JWQ78_413, partial [Sediminibacterium sp.]|nr:hypothetical protein [Sediminibacterium sp.]
FYYDAADLVHSGYWGWSENLGSLLPLDYEGGGIDKL